MAYNDDADLMTVTMNDPTTAITLTVTEARANLPALLDRVAQGDEITITRHGLAVAVLMPSERVKTRRKAVQEALARADELGRQLDEARARAKRGEPLPPPTGNTAFYDEWEAERRAEHEEEYAEQWGDTP